MTKGSAATPNASELENWQSGQDHLAIYLHNGNEYLESMLGRVQGAGRARSTSTTATSPTSSATCCDDARREAIVYHSPFAPMLAEVLPRTAATLERLPPGAPTTPATGCSPGPCGTRTRSPVVAGAATGARLSPDDLYILYTGGTTGMPKGVLWRQGDARRRASAARPTPPRSTAAVAEASAPAPRRCSPRRSCTARATG